MSVRRMVSRPALCGLALALGLLVRAGLTAADPPAASRPDPDSPTAVFEALNRECRSAYAWARAEVLRKQCPIILADLDTLTLLDGKKRESVTVTPRAQL